MLRPRNRAIRTSSTICRPEMWIQSGNSECGEQAQGEPLRLFGQDARQWLIFGKRGLPSSGRSSPFSLRRSNDVSFSSV